MTVVAPSVPALTLLIALGVTAPAAAQRPATYLRFEGGYTALHGSNRTGEMQGIRFGKAFGSRGRLRTVFGVTHGSADEGYWTAEAGVEARPFPRAPITPVLGVGTGLLAEPEFGGPLFGVNLGVDARLSPDATLRFGVTAAEHGGEKGPDLIYGGIEIH